MNIVVGVLGGIAAIWLFFRGLTELGVSLSSLNPALRHRRKQWKDRSSNPIYNIGNPLEITALLMVAAASSSSGEISTEAKLTILKLFEDAFHLSNKDASSLLIASAYLLRDGSELRENLQRVMQQSLHEFTREQAASALSMIEHIASLDQTVNPAKKELVARIKEHLEKK